MFLPMPMPMDPAPLSPKDLEEAFIKVTFEEDSGAQHNAQAGDPFYDPWVDQSGYCVSRTLRGCSMLCLYSLRQVRRAFAVWVCTTVTSRCGRLNSTAVLDSCASSTRTTPS